MTKAKKNSSRKSKVKESERSPKSAGEPGSLKTGKDDPSPKKKKPGVSFKISPRVVKVSNPKNVKFNTASENRNKKTSLLESQSIPLNDTQTGYLPQEASLPELSQAVVQKKLTKMLHLLDTRPINYVCVTDRRNRNCLHYAAYLGYTEILETLLNRKDSKKIIDAKDETGKTPLFKALESNSLSCVELLLQHDCDVKVQDENGISVMHVATLEENTILMKMLFKKNAELSAKDKLGFTPLHLAAGLGLKDPTLFLLRNRAEIDAKDNKGRTPLLAAAADANTDIIEVLLQHGADATVKDNKGRNAKNIFASMERRFSDIHPTRMLSSHHFSGAEVDRSNSFIADVKKVHDENVIENVSSRKSSVVTVLTPKSEDGTLKFTFDEKTVLEGSETARGDEETAREVQKDEKAISFYKDIVSPIDWKTLLVSPKKMRNSILRDSTKENQKALESKALSRLSDLPTDVTIKEAPLRPKPPTPRTPIQSTPQLNEIEELISPEMIPQQQAELLHSTFEGELQEYENHESLLQNQIEQQVIQEQQQPGSQINQRQPSLVWSQISELQPPLSQPGPQMNQFQRQSSLVGSQFGELHRPLSQPVPQMNQFQGQSSQTGSQISELQRPLSQSGSQSNQLHRQPSQTGSQISEFQRPSSQQGYQINQFRRQPSLIESQIGEFQRPLSQSGPQMNQFQRQSSLVESQIGELQRPLSQAVPQMNQFQGQPSQTGSQISELHRPLSQSGSQSNQLHRQPSQTGSQISEFQRPSSQQGYQINQFQRQPSLIESQIGEFQRPLSQPGPQINQFQRPISQQGSHSNELQRSLSQQGSQINQFHRQPSLVGSQIGELQRPMSQQGSQLNQLYRQPSQNGPQPNRYNQDSIDGFHKEQESRALLQPILPSEESRLPTFEEDRYLFLCLKNRELLLKKIQRCESLESDIRSGWKDHFPEEVLPKPSEITKDTSFIEENSTLREQLKNLQKENLDLNEHILFNQHLKRGRSRSRSSRKKRSDSKMGNKRITSDSGSDDTEDDEKDDETSAYSYNEGDSYFQDTINKLLKENILLKKSHLAYEKCHKDLQEECDGYKSTIESLQQQLKKEIEKSDGLTKDNVDVVKAHIALEQAHIELDYGMKKLLEDNVDMKKDLDYYQSPSGRQSSIPALKLPQKSSLSGGVPKPKKRPDIPKRPSLPKEEVKKPKAPKRKPRKKMFILF